MNLKDEPVVKQIAKELGLGRYRNAEQAIREYCIKKVEQLLKLFEHVDDLSKFLDVISSGLGVRFEQIYDDNDLDVLIRKYASSGELAFANLPNQLDNKTDAVLIRLLRQKEWKFVAVIDCRGNKKYKAYFSKWHEIAHVLTMSPQTEIQFRRTPTIKKDPEEQMVDRVAGDLAFYSPLFMPELLTRAKIDKRLSFDNIEDLRKKVCPDSSREATIRAAVYRSPFPQLLIIASYALKKQDERLINADQENLFRNDHDVLSSLKLRAVEATGNENAKKVGLWIHRNMEIPNDSIITKVFNTAPANVSAIQIEDLDWWKHSRGQLDSMPIQVEAMKIGRRVFALIKKTKFID